MTEYKLFVFYCDVIIILIMLSGVIWSIATPRRRIWPPPSKKSWQYIATWLGYYLVLLLNTLLIISDWNTWLLDSPLRFIIGIPLLLIGLLLSFWGIQILGTKNTSGQKDGFIYDGPYRFTRNPQYLGAILMFIGLSIGVNSLYLWITHLLLIFVFILAPVAEEHWLEEQYGEAYREYLRNTARFL